MDNEELKKKAAEGADKAKETAGKAAGKAKEFYGKAKESEIVKKISAKTKLGANAILGIAGGIVLVLLVVIIANVGGGKKGITIADDSGKKVKVLNPANKNIKAPSKANPPTDFEYDLTKEGDGIIIKNYIGKKKTIIRIPDKIEGYPVVEIGTEAFEHIDTEIVGIKIPMIDGNTGAKFTRTYNKPIELIYVPRSVVRVAPRVFDTVHKHQTNRSGDLYLTGVLLVDMDVSKLKSFGEGDPIGGLQLKDTDIVISKDFNASKSAPPTKQANYYDLWSLFSGSNVTSVKFEDGAKIISDSMFAGCENLKTVTIPASVTEIHDGAFSGCENLETVNFAPGAKIKYLPNPNYYSDRSEAFSGCPKLSLKMRQAIKDTGYTGEF